MTTSMQSILRVRTARIRLCSFAVLLAAMLSSSACSTSRFVASSMGNVLAEDSLVYAGDDDIELVGAAVPFGLKTMEALLVKVPEHRGLLTAAARGFTQYAYVFVQLPADELEEQDVAAAYAERARARRLYLRARNYGLRGLGLGSEEALARLRREPDASLADMGPAQLEALYWTGIAWSAAISLGKDRPQLIADLPVVDAMVARTAALDPKFDDGGLQTFLISYEMGRPGAGADSVAIATRHFRRAVELSSGERVAPFVAMAESVCVANNQRREFEALLQQALDVDADEREQWRLANHVMQRRARWLLARTDTFFLE